jgi:hypothetical protein
MTTVLICDDEGARASSLRQKLRTRLTSISDVEVTAMSPIEFIEAIAGLEERQRNARDVKIKGSGGKVPDEAAQAADHPFDSVDVLFVDYDLVRLATIDSSGPRAESGERVCYLARCFSRCGAIVAYNQFSYGQSFDLTLRGHLRSFADLNISMESASSAGLWGDSHRGFRPWYWPILISTFKELNHRTEFLADHLHDSILATLGLDDDQIYKIFSREQLGFLTSTKDPKTASFDDFVTNSSNGLRPRDVLWEPQAAARIAAARIHKWLERAVLPQQNILVDAPHLISRFPSLMGTSRSQARWNATCQLTVPVSALGLDSQKLEAGFFGAEAWLSRPTWLWPVVSLNEHIAEVKDPWSARDPRLVFCEDISRFRPRSEAKEFIAEVTPEFSRRYVHVVEGVSYQPAVRMLM